MCSIKMWPWFGLWSCCSDLDLKLCPGFISETLSFHTFFSLNWYFLYLNIIWTFTQLTLFALKVSWSLYCFTLPYLKVMTTIYLGCGIQAFPVLFLYLGFVTFTKAAMGAQKCAQVTILIHSTRVEYPFFKRNAVKWSYSLKINIVLFLCI